MYYDETNHEMWTLFSEAYDRAETDDTIITVGYYNPSRDTHDNWIEVKRRDLWASYDDDKEIVESIRDEHEPNAPGTKDFEEVIDALSFEQQVSVLYCAGLVSWVEVWAPLKDAKKHEDEEMVEDYQRKIDSGNPDANLNRCIDHGSQTYRFYRDIEGENPFL